LAEAISAISTVKTNVFFTQAPYPSKQRIIPNLRSLSTFWRLYDIISEKKLHFFNMCPPQYEPVLKYIFLEVKFHAL